ncbi:hypothetical protein C8R44DRAFT_738155 [Mycena epipterygia]|nr:hypothetical protein C8R44DRAFT_738155 [Mycena epipterygia]
MSDVVRIGRGREQGRIRREVYAAPEFQRRTEGTSKAECPVNRYWIVGKKGLVMDRGLGRRGFEDDYDACESIVTREMRRGEGMGGYDTAKTGDVGGEDVQRFRGAEEPRDQLAGDGAEAQSKYESSGADETPWCVCMSCTWRKRDGLVFPGRIVDFHAPDGSGKREVLSGAGVQREHSGGRRIRMKAADLPEWS